MKREFIYVYYVLLHLYYGQMQESVRVYTVVTKSSKWPSSKWPSCIRQTQCLMPRLIVLFSKISYSDYYC